MSEKFNPDTDCHGCGQTLTILNGGITMCPSEDGVQSQEVLPKVIGLSRPEVIVIDGQQVINPFSPIDTRIKNLFDRAHDARFANLKDAWYPEQRKDWRAA